MRKAFCPFFTPVIISSLTFPRYFSLFSPSSSLSPFIPLISLSISPSLPPFLVLSITPLLSVSRFSFYFFFFNLSFTFFSSPPSLFLIFPFFILHLFSFSSFIFLYTCILLSPLLPNSSLFPFSVSHIKLSPRLSREHYITPGCLNLGTNIYQSYCIAARRGGRGAPGGS